MRPRPRSLALALLVISVGVTACDFFETGSGGSGSGAQGVGGSGDSGQSSSSYGYPMMCESPTCPGYPTASSVGAGAGGFSCHGQIVTGDASCDACLDVACCSQVGDCINPTTPCGQYNACLNACGGSTSCTHAQRDMCDAAVPGGKAANDELFVTCLGANCNPECGGGEACASGITTGVAACDQCLTESCCDSWNAVGAEGAQGLADLNACATDPTCNGNQHAVDANRCEMDSCGTACSGLGGGGAGGMGGAGGG